VVEACVLAGEISVLSKISSGHCNKSPAWRKGFNTVAVYAVKVHTWMTTANFVNLGAIAVA